MGAVVSIRAQSGDATTLSDAIEAYFAAVDLGATTRDVYQATLTNLEQAPPVEVALADIDRPTLIKHLEDRYGALAASTFNRNLATISSLFAWCVENDLIAVSPVKGIRRRKQRRPRDKRLPILITHQHPRPKSRLRTCRQFTHNRTNQRR